MYISSTPATETDITETYTISHGKVVWISLVYKESNTEMYNRKKKMCQYQFAEQKNKNMREKNILKIKSQQEIARCQV